MALASNFSDPLRICISNSVGCYGGRWSFSPGSGLSSQAASSMVSWYSPVSDKTALQKKWHQLSVPPCVILNHRVTPIPIKSLSIPGPCSAVPTEIWTSDDSKYQMLGQLTPARCPWRWQDCTQPEGRLLWQVEGCCLWCCSPSVGCWE